MNQLLAQMKNHLEFEASLEFFVENGTYSEKEAIEWRIWKYNILEANE